MKFGNNPDHAPADTGKTAQRDPHGESGTTPDSPAAGAVQQEDSNRMPVFDTRRINEIRQAIADGSYRTDPARIAARLWRLVG
jgi:flagellar biosynthesis anti-sigma factor FlgM